MKQLLVRNLQQPFPGLLLLATLLTAFALAPRLLAQDDTALVDSAGRDFVERRVMDVYRQVSPAVVTVTTTVLTVSPFYRPVPAEGSGSGFVVDEDGLIVTNFHVIDGARAVEVGLFDGTTLPARVIGADPANDLALLQVDPQGSGLVAARLGDSTGLEVGQRAIAIGNPFGEFGQTLTTGVISALDRSLLSRDDRQISGVIQTDAPINQGNSGGPLLDSSGRVIGINTAIFSPTGTNAGIGFAIPIDTVERVLPELAEFGRYRHPWLGIDAAYELFPALAQALNLPVERGLLLVQLRPGSPLERAGVRGAQRQVVVGNRLVYVGGDIVTAVDGTPVESRSGLRELLDTRYQVGDTVVVTVVGNEGPREVTVTLTEEPF